MPDVWHTPIGEAPVHMAAGGVASVQVGVGAPPVVDGAGAGAARDARSHPGP